MSGLDLLSYDRGSDQLDKRVEEKTYTCVRGSVDEVRFKRLMSSSAVLL